MSEPTRQCAACREHRSKADLLRVVKRPDGAVVFDIRQNTDGRGAYVCADAQCLAKARKSDALGRVLKGRVPESIYLELAKAVAEPEASPEALLGFALKSRRAVVGTTGVELGLKRGTVRLVLVDPSAAPATLDRIQTLCAALKRGLRVWPETDGLARITGKVNCRLVGITDGAFAHGLKKRLPASS